MITMVEKKGDCSQALMASKKTNTNAQYTLRRAHCSRPVLDHDRIDAGVGEFQRRRSDDLLGRSDNSPHHGRAHWSRLGRSQVPPACFGTQILTKKPLKPAFVVWVFGAFLLLIGANQAHASTVYVQPAIDQQFTDVATFFPTEAKTALQSQSINTISIYVNRVNPADTQFTLRISTSGCNNQTNTYNYSDYGITDTNTYHLLSLPFSYTFPADMTGCVIALTASGGGAHVATYGSNGSWGFFFPASAFCNTGTCVLNPLGDDFSTHFIKPYTPSNGAITSSTTVSFSYQYYFNDVQSFSIYDTVAIDILDATAGDQDMTRFGFTTINASGVNSLSKSRQLVEGHLYLWQPVMFLSSGSSTPLRGDIYSLNILYAAGSSTPFVGATIGTSTLPDVTNLLSFLNVPMLLQTKVPFGYLFEVKDAILSAINGSSSTAIPSGTFSVRIGGNASTSVDMFSTTTIGYYLSPSLIAILRGLMVVVLYAEFAYLLYNRAKALHIL